jgi:hypothetical protein
MLARVRATYLVMLPLGRRRLDDGERARFVMIASERQLRRAVDDGLVDAKYLDLAPDGKGDDCVIM